MYLQQGSVWLASADIILVPGNSFVKSDNTLSMASGEAKVLAEKYPSFPLKFGTQLKQNYSNPDGTIKEYNFLFVSTSSGKRFGLFQNKQHYNDAESVEIITRSVAVLKQKVLETGMVVALASPATNTGFGPTSLTGLNSILSELPDGVVIYY